MLRDIEKFRGVFVAMYACYDAQGRVCPDKTRDLARWYRQVGVHGLYLNGSSGEGMLLDVTERMLISRTVKEAVGDSMTLIEHVGAMTTRDAKRLAKHAAEVGMDAVSSVPCMYYPLPEKDIEAYWDDLMEAARLPFIIYNVPGTTGYQLSRTLFERMVNKPFFAGIKNTTESNMTMRSYLQTGGENCVVYSGEDGQLLGGLSMGVTGGIGGSYGCMPEVFVKLYQAFVNHKPEEALRWQDLAIKVLTQGRAPGAMGLASNKAILAARGIDLGGTRKPLQPVDPAHPAIQHAKTLLGKVDAS